MAVKQFLILFLILSIFVSILLAEELRKQQNGIIVENEIDCLNICYDYFRFDDGICIEIFEDVKEDKNPAQIIYSFFLETEYKEVAHLITAQSALETGWWRDKFHNDRQNYWSRKMMPNGKTCLKAEKNCLLTHKDVDDSCVSMLNYLRRKGYSVDSENYLKDLKRKNFAEDEKYIEKIRAISKIILEKI